MTTSAVSSSSITPQQNSSLEAQIGNTLLTGVSAAYLFGPVVGVCCMVANVALAQLHDQKSSDFWFPLNSDTVEHLKNYWKDSGHNFKVQAVMGIVLRVLGISIYSLDALSSPHKALYFIFQLCIAAPFLEEALFRGFLQEKIRDVQVCLFGKEGDSGKVHIITRVALQAIAFGAVHYQAVWGLFNIYVVSTAGLLGFTFGFTKEIDMIREEFRKKLIESNARNKELGIESEKTEEDINADKTIKELNIETPRHLGLWTTTAMHGHHNAAITARFFAFGV